MGQETLHMGLKTFLGEGIELKGELKFNEALRIDGKFQGLIQSSNSLIVGETATIDAKVSVANLVVLGCIKGEIDVTNKIELKDKSKVFGNINTSSLDIKEGAIFEGECKMSKKTDTDLSSVDTKHAKTNDKKIKNIPIAPFKSKPLRKFFNGGAVSK